MFTIRNSALALTRLACNELIHKTVPLAINRNVVKFAPFVVLQNYSAKFASQQTQEGIVKKDPSLQEKQLADDIITKVNNLVKENKEGRLFAVVQVCGKQFKITTNDIIVVDGYWPPQPGDQIRLEKVLLLGGDKFTLIGTPLLPLDQVSIYATIVEKSLSHTRTRFVKVPKKQFQRINFLKKEMTYIRINKIEVTGEVNNLGSTDGLKDKVF